MLWTYDITGENELSMTNDTYADNIFWYPVAYVLTPVWCASYFATDPRFPFLFRDGTAQKEWRRRRSEESAAACRNPQTKAAGPCSFSRQRRFPNPQRLVPSPEYLMIVLAGFDCPLKKKECRTFHVKSIEDSSLSCV